jgi:hypothetical protein
MGIALLIIVLAIVVILMPQVITAPGPLRPTTETRAKPGAMKTAITAPGPICVSATGTVDGGSVPLEAAAGANNAAYWGYAIKACNANEQPMLGNGAIVENFAGLTQGGLVYLANADGTLTHTATSNGNPIGIAVSATKIYFFQDAGGVL